MSASVMWAPNDSGKSLGVMAPSSFMEAMEAAGLCLPCDLNVDEHYAVLKGMMAAAGGRRVTENPYRDLLDLLDKHESIRIWAEY
jgi:hypothetical protein